MPSLYWKLCLKWRRSLDRKRRSLMIPVHLQHHRHHADHLSIKCCQGEEIHQPRPLVRLSLRTPLQTTPTLLLPHHLASGQALLHLLRVELQTMHQHPQGEPAQERVWIYYIALFLSSKTLSSFETSSFLCIPYRPV